MYTDKIFEEVKIAMVAELKKTTASNFNEYLEWSKPHIKIIEQLQIIKDLNGIVPEEHKTDIDETILAPKNTNQEKDKAEEEYPIGGIFSFNKLASGGIIKELSYPIPEELVRNLQLENGNKVKITGIKEHSNNYSAKYEFEIIDRTEVPNPLLVTIEHGIVDEVAGRLVVMESASGAIRIDENPVTLYINEKDARKGIRKGDIVNGRFYTNNVTNSFRVSYKHNIESVSVISDERKKLQHRQSIISPTETGNSMIASIDKTPFLGKKILLVGLRSRVSDFKQYLNNMKKRKCSAN